MGPKVVPNTSENASTYRRFTSCMDGAAPVSARMLVCCRPTSPQEMIAPKRPEIDRDVERRAVTGHPALAAEPHRRDLGTPHVEPGRARSSLRLHAETRQQVDERLLEAGDESPEIAAWYGHDGVTDELSGRMQRGRAAPFRLDHGQVARPEWSGIHEVGCAASAPEGDHRLVLEEQEHPRQVSLRDVSPQVALQLDQGGVRSKAQVEHRDRGSRDGSRSARVLRG